MKALIIGATGATGEALVNQVLNDSYFSAVIVFVRKPLQLHHPKLTVHVVDFNQPKTWHHLVEGDIAFSAMGTTLKAAGSKAAQWKVDYDYQFNFAVAAAENNVTSFVLVSAQNASTNAFFFYSKMKGKLEEAIRKLNFQSILVFNPPLLNRPNSNRTGEVGALKIINFLNEWGIFKSLAAMKTTDLAAAMIRVVKKNLQGFHQWVGQDIHKA